MDIGSGDLRFLNGIIRSFGLETLAPEPPRQQPYLDPETGEEMFTLCLHATYYVLELVDERGSWFAYRTSCNLSEDFDHALQDLRNVLNDSGLR